MKIKFKKDSSMKEKKLSLFTLFLLLLMLPSLYAKYSDEFPYGIYANLRNGDKGLSFSLCHYQFDENFGV
jgi:hypothetical protein